MPSLLPIVAVTVELRAKLAPKLAPKLTLRNAPAVLDNELLTARPRVFATAWPTDEFTAWLVKAEIAVPADFAIALPADSDMLFDTELDIPCVTASEAFVPIWLAVLLCNALLQFASTPNTSNPTLAEPPSVSESPTVSVCEEFTP